MHMLILLFWLPTQPAIAIDYPVQELEKTNSPASAEEHPALQVFRAFSKRIENSEIDEAASLMTAGAADEFAVNTVVQCKKWLEPAFAARYPERKDVIQALTSAFDKHGLKAFITDLPEMPELQMSFHELQLKNSSAKGFEVAKKIHVKILAELDKNGNRWKIVADLRLARKQDPMEQILLHEGEAEEIEVDDGKAFLRVVPGTRNFPNDVAARALMPRAVVRMSKEQNDWKFDGADSRRSRDVIRSSPLFKLNSGR